MREVVPDECPLDDVERGSLRIRELGAACAGASFVDFHAASEAVANAALLNRREMTLARRWRLHISVSIVELTLSTQFGSSN